MAIANQILDFVDDLDQSLLKLIVPSAPEHVKTAQILDPEKREALSEDSFALVLMTKEAQVFKKFPIHDEAHTWLSNQYFEKTCAALPWFAQKVAATMLKNACVRFKLEPGIQVSKLASTENLGNRYHETADWKKNLSEPTQTKIASAVGSDGSKYFYALGKSYAMPSPDYTKKAAAYFVEHEREFEDAEDRHEFATNVLARAQELNVQLECAPALQKYASTEYGDRLASQIKFRAEVLQHKPDMSAALDKLAAFQGSTDAPTFARALYLFDKKAGVDKYYGRGQVQDAFASTFARTKEAASYHWENKDGSLKMSGKDLQKLANEKNDKVKSYFGETMANSIKKEPAPIFDSLPVDAQETLARISHGEI